MDMQGKIAQVSSGFSAWPASSSVLCPSRARWLAVTFRDMVKKEPPTSYTAAGNPIAWGQCGAGTLTRHRVLVRGPLSHGIVCTTCGLAMWFETTPVVVVSELMPFVH